MPRIKRALAALAAFAATALAPAHAQTPDRIVFPRESIRSTTST